MSEQQIEAAALVLRDTWNTAYRAASKARSRLQRALALGEGTGILWAEYRVEMDKIEDEIRAACAKAWKNYNDAKAAIDQ